MVAITHANQHAAIAESALAHALTPEVRSAALTDQAIAVLTKTAADWFAPALARCLCVSVVCGRIRLTGHLQDARPLARLKAALMRLPGIGGLDQLITVEPMESRTGSHPPQAHPAHSLHPQTG